MKNVFKKNKVYRLQSEGPKLRCVIVDEETACLCPITPHTKDTGYSTKLSSPSLYATDISTNSIFVEEIGEVKPPNYIAHKEPIALT